MITTRSPLTPTMTPSQATGGQTTLFPFHIFLPRHPLYKKAWDAFEIEIPHLVKNSSVGGHLKPEIKLIRLMKSTGGFVQGYIKPQRSSMTLIISAHYQITFKRPHWNNSEGFIDAMEEICAAYKLLPAEEGLWGNVTERYVKHDFQVKRIGKIEANKITPTGAHSQAVEAVSGEGGGSSDGGGGGGRRRGSCRARDVRRRD